MKFVRLATIAATFASLLAFAQPASPQTQASE